MLSPFVRVRFSPSILGYALVGLGILLAALFPTTLIGLPGPGGYALSDYAIVPNVPIVPLVGVAIGAVTVWEVGRRSKLSGALALLSSGFIMSVALLWITAEIPGSFVRGLGFPLSWVLLLAYPLRPVQLLGASLIAFLGDWMLWTIFLDSCLFALERRRLRRSRQSPWRPH